MIKEAVEKEPKVSIILLNYCNYWDTIACINSLEYMNYTNYHIYVVDNHSPNDSLRELKKMESNRVTVIDSGLNGGFAFGNNIGIRYALKNSFDYILLLNNDTIVTRDFLKKLTKTAVNNSSDVTTCRIMYNDVRELVWYAGGSIDWFNQRAVHQGINQQYTGDTHIREVSFVSGCCMLLSKKCLDLLGEFPEEYFMYYEDLDFCKQAIDKGLKILYDPNVFIYHCVSACGGGSDSPFVVEWSNRSRRIFMKKYSSCFKRPKIIMSFVWCEVKTILKLLMTKDRCKSLKAYCKSFKMNCEKDSITL